MPEPKRPLKVFLCHAHADRVPVRGLYTRLTQDGVDAWLDKAKLLPGQDWELEIRKAVREADVVVVCLSKQFNQAGFRQKEVRLALDTAMEKPEGEIFIIPARLEECENLESLRRWHVVDLFEDDGYEMLMRALRARADKISVTLQIKKRQEKPTSKKGIQTQEVFNKIIIIGIIGIVLVALAEVFTFGLRPLIGQLLVPTTTTRESSKTFAPISTSKTIKLTSTPSGTPSSVTLAPSSTRIGLSPNETPNSDYPSGKIVFTCVPLGNADFNEICIMNADGSGYKQLTNNDANNGWPSISPDGGTVLFSSNASGSWQIYSMASNGQSLQQLTFGPSEAVAPDMSPNGQIVYKDSQVDSIWVMNSNGEGAHQVYRNGWDPVWSPDGSHILFASGELDSPSLYTINANGSGLTQLTNIQEIRGRSDWSPDNLITFYAGPSWQRNIYTIGADGSNLTKITNGGNSQGPSFSPDGKWIVFTGYFDFMGEIDGCEIYAIRVDGRDRRRLTSNSYCDWQPRWGP